MDGSQRYVTLHSPQPPPIPQAILKAVRDGALGEWGGREGEKKQEEEERERRGNKASLLRG